MGETRWQVAHWLTRGCHRLYVRPDVFMVAQHLKRLVRQRLTSLKTNLCRNLRCAETHCFDDLRVQAVMRLTRCLVHLLVLRRHGRIARATLQCTSRGLQVPVLPQRAPQTSTCGSPLLKLPLVGTQITEVAAPRACREVVCLVGLSWACGGPRCLIRIRKSRCRPHLLGTNKGRWKARSVEPEFRMPACSSRYKRPFSSSWASARAAAFLAAWRPARSWHQNARAGAKRPPHG